MEFDRPFASHGTWDETGGHPGGRSSMQGDTRPHGAWFTFDTSKNRAVTAVSAISHVDIEGARRKLKETKKEDKNQLKLPLSEQKYKTALVKLKKDLESLRKLLS